MTRKETYSCCGQVVLNLCFFLFILFSVPVSAQDFFQPATGRDVPPEVEKIYVKGLKYLAAHQDESGTWQQDNYGIQPGVVGLCVVAMLAHGDDPNYGPYADNIKQSIDYLLLSANPKNGYIGTSMYNHGFATLALAESYGAVHDDRIGPALEKAVKLILTAQAANSHKAWRYSPESADADTTVSGACLVALLAAANAGINVPDKAVKDALEFYISCQGADGGIGYVSPGGSNMTRTAIGALVFSLAAEKGQAAYKKETNYLKKHLAERNSSYYFYYLYYGSQAFFHMPDHTAWQKWNKLNIKNLQILQLPDGSWNGQFGYTFSTASALLSLALNYRFLPIYER